MRDEKMGKEDLLSELQSILRKDPDCFGAVSLVNKFLEEHEQEPGLYETLVEGLADFEQELMEVDLNDGNYTRLLHFNLLLHDLARADRDTEVIAQLMAAKLGDLMDDMFSTTYHSMVTTPKACRILDDLSDIISSFASHDRSSHTVMVDLFLEKLFKVSLDDGLPWTTRLQVMKALNLLADGASIEATTSLRSSKEFELKLLLLAETIFEVGDYEIQVCTLEAIYRLGCDSSRDEFAKQWLKKGRLLQLFLSMRQEYFETDARTFLNAVNTHSKTGVVPVPCRSVHLGHFPVHKPPDSDYTHFWVDFNQISRRISLFCAQEPGDDSQQVEDLLWDTIAINTDSVTGYTTSVSGDSVSLSIVLRHDAGKLITFGPRIQDHTVMIVFDKRHDVKTLLAEMKFGQKSDQSSTQYVESQSQQLTGQSRASKKSSAPIDAMRPVTQHPSDHETSSQASVVSKKTAPTAKFLPKEQAVSLSQPQSQSRGRKVSQTITDMHNAQLRPSKSNVVQKSSQLEDIIPETQQVKQRSRSRRKASESIPLAERRETRGGPRTVEPVKTKPTPRAPSPRPGSNVKRCEPKAPVTPRSAATKPGKRVKTPLQMVSGPECQKTPEARRLAKKCSVAEEKVRNWCATGPESRQKTSVIQAPEPSTPNAVLVLADVCPQPPLTPPDEEEQDDVQQLQGEQAQAQQLEEEVEEATEQLVQDTNEEAYRKLTSMIEEQEKKMKVYPKPVAKASMTPALSTVTEESSGRGTNSVRSTPRLPGAGPAHSAVATLSGGRKRLDAIREEHSDIPVGVIKPFGSQCDTKDVTPAEEDESQVESVDLGLINTYKNPRSKKSSKPEPKQLEVQESATAEENQNSSKGKKKRKSDEPLPKKGPESRRATRNSQVETENNSEDLFQKPKPRSRSRGRPKNESETETSDSNTEKPKMSKVKESKKSVKGRKVNVSDEMNTSDDDLLAAVAMSLETLESEKSKSKDEISLSNEINTSDDDLLAAVVESLETSSPEIFKNNNKKMTNETKKAKKSEVVKKPEAPERKKNIAEKSKSDTSCVEESQSEAEAEKSKSNTSLNASQRSQTKYRIFKSKAAREESQSLSQNSNFSFGTPEPVVPGTQPFDKIPTQESETNDFQTAKEPEKEKLPEKKIELEKPKKKSRWLTKNASSTIDNKKAAGKTAEVVPLFEEQPFEELFGDTGTAVEREESEEPREKTAKSRVERTKKKIDKAEKARDESRDDNACELKSRGRRARVETNEEIREKPDENDVEAETRGLEARDDKSRKEDSRDRKSRKLKTRNGPRVENSRESEPLDVARDSFVPRDVPPDPEPRDSDPRAHENPRDPGPRVERSASVSSLTSRISETQHTAMSQASEAPSVRSLLSAKPRQAVKPTVKAVKPRVQKAGGTFMSYLNFSKPRKHGYDTETVSQEEDSTFKPTYGGAKSGRIAGFKRKSLVDHEPVIAVQNVVVDQTSQFDFNDDDCSSVAVLAQIQKVALEKPKMLERRRLLPNKTKEVAKKVTKVARENTKKNVFEFDDRISDITIGRETETIQDAEVEENIDSDEMVGQSSDLEKRKNRKIEKKEGKSTEEEGKKGGRRLGKKREEVTLFDEEVEAEDEVEDKATKKKSKKSKFAKAPQEADHDNSSQLRNAVQSIFSTVASNISAIADKAKSTVRPRKRDGKKLVEETPKPSEADAADAPVETVSETTVDESSKSVTFSRPPSSVKSARFKLYNPADQSLLEDNGQSQHAETTPVKKRRRVTSRQQAKSTTSRQQTSVTSPGRAVTSSTECDEEPNVEALQPIRAVSAEKRREASMKSVKTPTDRIVYTDHPKRTKHVFTDTSNASDAKSEVSWLNPTTEQKKVRKPKREYNAHKNSPQKKKRRKGGAEKSEELFDSIVDVENRKPGRDAPHHQRTYSDTRTPQGKRRVKVERRKSLNEDIELSPRTVAKMQELNDLSTEQLRCETDLENFSQSQPTIQSPQILVRRDSDSSGDEAMGDLAADLPEDVHDGVDTELMADIDAVIVDDMTEAADSAPPLIEDFIESCSTTKTPSVKKASKKRAPRTPKLSFDFAEKDDDYQLADGLEAHISPIKTPKTPANLARLTSDTDLLNSQPSQTLSPHPSALSQPVISEPLDECITEPLEDSITEDMSEPMPDLLSGPSSRIREKKRVAKRNEKKNTASSLLSSSPILETQEDITSQAGMVEDEDSGDLSQDSLYRPRKLSFTPKNLLASTSKQKKKKQHQSPALAPEDESDPETESETESIQEESFAESLAESSFEHDPNMSAKTMMDVFGQQYTKKMEHRKQSIDKKGRQTVKMAANQVLEQWHEHQTVRGGFVDKFTTALSSEIQTLEGQINDSRKTEAEMMEFLRRQLDRLGEQRAGQLDRVKVLKTLYKTFNKRYSQIERLQTEQQQPAISTILKRQIGGLQKAVLKDMQKQELGNMKRALHRMMFQ